MILSIKSGLWNVKILILELYVKSRIIILIVRLLLLLLLLRVCFIFYRRHNLRWCLSCPFKRTRRTLEALLFSIATTTQSVVISPPHEHMSRSIHSPPRETSQWTTGRATKCDPFLSNHVPGAYFIALNQTYHHQPAACHRMSSLIHGPAERWSFRWQGKASGRVASPPSVTKQAATSTRWTTSRLSSSNCHQQPIQ